MAPHGVRVGESRFFTGIVDGGKNLPPRGWALCDDSLLSISRCMRFGARRRGNGVNAFTLPVCAADCWHSTVASRRYGRAASQRGARLNELPYL